MKEGKTNLLRVVSIWKRNDLFGDKNKFELRAKLQLNLIISQDVLLLLSEMNKQNNEIEKKGKRMRSGVVVCRRRRRLPSRVLE